MCQVEIKEVDINTEKVSSQRRSCGWQPVERTTNRMKSQSWEIHDLPILYRGDCIRDANRVKFKRGVYIMTFRAAEWGLVMPGQR